MKDFFTKLTENKAGVRTICIALVITFIILAIECLPPLLQIGLAFAYAAVIAALTLITYRFAHSLCRMHSPQELALHKFLKWRLIIAGASITIWIGGLALGRLYGYGAAASAENIFSTIGILFIANALGAFLSICSILMSRHVRAWFLSLSFLSGILVTLLPLIIGVFLAFLFTLIFLTLFKGFILALGVGVWIYTFYLLTRPCAQKRHPLPTTSYILTLTGNKSQLDISPAETPFSLTPDTYSSLCSDTSSLPIAPFSIHCSPDGKSWTLHPVASAGCTVLHNGSPVYTTCILESGSSIMLQQSTASPRSKNKSTDRQVLSIALFGDIGHADFFPMNAPQRVSSSEYQKASSDGSLIQDSPYELSTDAAQSGSTWYITPINESAWEVMVNDELLTSKSVLKIGSTISLRKRGSTEEVARVIVKSRNVFETTPGHPTSASSDTLVLGQLSVTIKMGMTK